MRLKQESRKASCNRVKEIHSEINYLYRNMEKLDPDRTKRLKLFFIYMKERLDSNEGKKRLALLVFSLSDLLHFCDAQSDDIEFFTKQLAENKKIAKIIQNEAVKNQLKGVKSPAFLHTQHKR